MNIETLVEIGFTRNEALVYLTISSFKQCSSTTLLSECGLPKSSLYVALAELLDAGLIAEVDSVKANEYRITSHDNLTDYVEIRQKKLISEKQYIHRLFHGIQYFKKSNELAVEFFVGKDRIIEAYDRSLFENREGHMYLFSSFQSVDNYFSSYMYGYEQNRASLSITSECILTKDIDNIAFLKDTPAHLDKFHIAKKAPEINGELALYDNRICFSAFLADFSYIVHIDDLTAEYFKGLFKRICACEATVLDFSL